MDNKKFANSKLNEQELEGVAGGDLSPEHGSGRIPREGRVQEYV